MDGDGVESAFAELEERLERELEGATYTRAADLRYRRQAFELTVSADEWDGIAERFHAEHERRHGYAMPDEPVEVVALRVTATVQGAAPSLTEEPGHGARARRGARGALRRAGRQRAGLRPRPRWAPGTSSRAPRSSSWPRRRASLRPGWRARVDDAGNDGADAVTASIPSRCRSSPAP